MRVARPCIAQKTKSESLHHERSTLRTRETRRNTISSWEVTPRPCSFFNIPYWSDQSSDCRLMRFLPLAPVGLAAVSVAHVHLPKHGKQAMQKLPKMTLTAIPMMNTAAAGWSDGIFPSRYHARNRSKRHQKSISKLSHFRQRQHNRALWAACDRCLTSANLASPA